MLLTVLRKKGSDDTRRRIIYFETSQKALQSPHDFVHPTESDTTERRQARARHRVAELLSEREVAQSCPTR